MCKKLNDEKTIQYMEYVGLRSARNRWCGAIGSTGSPARIGNTQGSFVCFFRLVQDGGQTSSEPHSIPERWRATYSDAPSSSCAFVWLRG